MKKKIKGFVIMDGEQLGYSDYYTYFHREHSEACILLHEADAPSMKVVPATLIIDVDENKKAES